MALRRVAVAYSGGRDSTALLHATRRAATALGVEVLALHVQHGLHPDAEAWLRHCRRVCARWGVAFDACRLAGSPASGESTEAWARSERYRALAAMAQAHRVSLVLLAQHRRDQAETFLLQALRGGGPFGLASMGTRREAAGIVWMRPWLGQPREAIEAYVSRHRLGYLDDPANAQPRHARSRLRRAVWPHLLAAFPHVEASLADAARRAADAAELLDEIAQHDLAEAASAGSLDVACWLRLTPARGRNVLRAWLAKVDAASSALIDRLMAELPAARQARWPASGGIELRLHRGRLSIARPLPAIESPATEERLRADRPGEYPLAHWPGRIVVSAVGQGGVAAERLLDLRVVPRAGGERFQLAPRSTPRSLRKQFQALGIPAWQRSAPLLYSGDALLFVPGLGIDARLRAAPGEPQLALAWIDETHR